MARKRLAVSNSGFLSTTPSLQSLFTFGRETREVAFHGRIGVLFGSFLTANSVGVSGFASEGAVTFQKNCPLLPVEFGSQLLLGFNRGIGSESLSQWRDLQLMDLRIMTEQQLRRYQNLAQVFLIFSVFTGTLTMATVVTRCQPNVELCLPKTYFYEIPQQFRNKSQELIFITSRGDCYPMEVIPRNQTLILAQQLINQTKLLFLQTKSACFWSRTWDPSSENLLPIYGFFLLTITFLMGLLITSSLYKITYHQYYRQVRRVQPLDDISILP
jgi:hypothetical protein